VWLPAFFLAFVFALQGSRKFSDATGWAIAFRHWGYPAWFRITIGFIELLAGALLLFGQSAPLGATLVVLVMIGGIGTHIAAGDPHKFTSELGPIALAVVVLVTRRRELRRVLHREKKLRVDASQGASL
jgi:uncharacterized membrane protein YphA (DoxX/SURF4 family)